ncbi:MAG TPA: carbon-nitrogen hydrolase family protein [Acidimicrobiales bacterium]|jgi:predicted amidohydrolase|nr:carbon-nitrogen hydrolase family protein [Acidimicrobiales bacterium]
MRVAAIQTTATADRADNLRAAGTLVDQAADAGAELVVVPEYFSVAGSSRSIKQRAETLEGPTVTWAAEQAERHHIWLVAGTFPERPDPASIDTRVRSTNCVLGPDGRVAAVYRKVHLFDVQVEGAKSHESATFAPGQVLSTVTLSPSRPDGPDPSTGEGGVLPADPVLGLSVCYDLRFPELYRILTLQGATIVTVPAAFTAATGPAHWEVLLRARAIENEVFVVAAGQIGELPGGMASCHGHSMIIDPWGAVMAEADDGVPGMVIADLDFRDQERVRRQLPVLANRQPATYRWPHGN